MSALIPAGMTTTTTGAAAAAVNLTRESPCDELTSDECEGRFCMTSGRGRVSRKETRDGGATTATIRRMQRGCGTLMTTVTGAADADADAATGGAGTRVRM